MTLFNFCKHSNTIVGDIAEVGVYKGGSAKLLCKTCPMKTVYLYDSFLGLTNPDLESQKNAFNDTSEQAVKEFLSDCRNKKIYPGIFPQSVKEDSVFSLVHLDGDLYQTTLDGLKYFYPLMNTGGIILLDDFGSNACPGVEKAVYEYVDGKNIWPILINEMQAIIIKN